MCAGNTEFGTSHVTKLCSIRMGHRISERQHVTKVCKGRRIMRNLRRQHVTKLCIIRSGIRNLQRQHVTKICNGRRQMPNLGGQHVTKLCSGSSKMRSLGLQHVTMSLDCLYGYERVNIGAASISLSEAYEELSIPHLRWHLRQWSASFKPHPHDDWNIHYSTLHKQEF